MRYSVLPAGAAFGNNQEGRAFRVTQEGVLIARTDQLQATDTHLLQVLRGSVFRASGEEGGG